MSAVPKPTRRRVLAGGLATAGVMATTPSWAFQPANAASAIPLTQVDDSRPTNVTRVWVGWMYWANRLQDWRLNRGRIEHLSTAGRSVGLLTYDIASGAQPASISVRTGTLAAGQGFSGILIGAGGGQLDPRAAALVQSASGTGGGLICTYESDGSVQFRDHTSEANQLSYRTFPVTNARQGSARTLAEDVTLRLDVVPRGNVFDLTGTATVTLTGQVLATATLLGVSDSQITGGISLFSAPLGTSSQSRHWFRALSVGGDKIEAHPEREVGPILGTLWSLSDGVFKLTAQFMPIGALEPHTARLDHRSPFGFWIPGPTAFISLTNYTAQFRVTNWDATKAWQYRVVYTDSTQNTIEYDGQVPADPGSSNPLTIGVVNCTIHSFRPLDVPSAAKLPLQKQLGLYTSDNLYFPYNGVASGLAANNPDLLAVLGDQLYENRPTAALSQTMPTLDYLGKYYLWLWAFRGITADIPTITLVDDHDVLQGNLWGHGGAAAPNGNNGSAGGYVKPGAFVNFVQSLQCAHNPDAFDPTPVLQGISVYFCTFRYGCVRFAVVEDRKFKGGDADETGPSGKYNLDTIDLLGARQEAFLQQWAGMDPGLAKVVLTQTLWGCLMTSGTTADLSDSNGSPRAARRRALSLVRSAGGLLLAGDQHLASVVRHGINTFSDGPVQFTVPPAGTSYARWFQPGSLPNNEGLPYTGDYVDAFGNKMHVRAVANPLVSWSALNAAGGTRDVGDEAIKRDGYGIVRVRPALQTFEIDCLPANGGPQYPGWPVFVPISG